MDTILDFNDLNHLGVTLRDQTLISEKLTWSERFSLWALRWCCGGTVDEVADRRFNMLTDKKIKNAIDDECEFSDLCAMYNLARDYVAPEPVLPVVDAPEVRDIVVYDADANIRLEVFAEIIGEYGVDVGPRDNDPDATEGIRGRVRRSYRRRRKVLAYCVVALVNKVRAKYYRLSDTEANRRMVAQYLSKLMKEAGFRTTDIHLHVDKAVEWYFRITPGIKPTVYART